MAAVYHKLVRDKIPQIIASTGKQCSARILSDEEYIQKLEEKLGEELQEYLQSAQVEELADLLEVMQALLKARGYSWEELVEIQTAKREKRGGFRQKILLEEVED